MRSFLFITALALVSGVRMETCPSADGIRPCECITRHNGDVLVKCTGKALSDQGVLKRVLSGLSGKQNVWLDLRHFPLGRVPSDFFSGVGIKTLYISGCDLDTLSEGGPAFKGLENTLADLTITRSFTGEQVPAKLQLGHLKRLKSLTLLYNTITELGDDWFQEGPPSLELLIIMDNRIEKIGSNAFANLVNLKYLYLAGNQFSQIHRSMFPSAANKIRILNLQDNPLIRLPEDIFTDMPKLTVVEIQSSGLKTLDENVWSPVWEQLRFITLIGNPIRCDDHMSWLFNLDGPRIRSGECASPEEVRGELIKDFIKSRRQLNVFPYLFHGA